MYYTSILDEHQTVRNRVGVFDVSHLGHLDVTGEDAVSQLQLLVTQDLAGLEAGRACYSPMLTSKGAILDEMIIYRLEPNRFRVVANAANGDKVLAWLKSRVNSKVEDLRAQIGTLALQGPKAVDVMERVSPGTAGRLRRYAVGEGTAAGRRGWIARTGYTGEDGFEIFFSVEDLPVVWEALHAAGKDWNLQAIGLGARDTLRLEAGLPLGGSDLDEKTTPLEAGLEWTVAWQKGPFVGRDALERQRREGVSRRLVGFELREPGIARPGYAIYRREEKIGRVTSGTMLAGNRAVGMGYVSPPAAKPAAEIQIEIHGRHVKAEVVKLPFYRRKK